MHWNIDVMQLELSWRHDEGVGSRELQRDKVREPMGQLGAFWFFSVIGA